MGSVVLVGITVVENVHITADEGGGMTVDEMVVLAYQCSSPTNAADYATTCHGVPPNVSVPPNQWNNIANVAYDI